MSVRAESHEITSRLFANIVRVNKLTKLEPIRGRRRASSSFSKLEYLGLKLYGFMTYLWLITITKRLADVVKNWGSYWDSSLVIPALLKQ